MIRVPRIFRRSESRGLRRASHGKLIHVCFSDNDCSRLFQIQHGFGGIGRHKIIENFRTAGCQQALRTHIIFNRHRHTGQRPRKFSGINLCLDFFGFFQSPFPVHGNKAVNLPFHGIYLSESGLHAFLHSYFFIFNLFSQFHCGQLH